ncbi:Imm1 family immunity protein [Streptomyces sp. MMBL 11-1]
MLRKFHSPLLREAVRQFLLSGGRRPTCVEWQEESEF